MEWGKYANNLTTLLIRDQIDVKMNEPIQFNVTIPNVQNFPHKSRCMVMVDSLSITISDNYNTIAGDRLTGHPTRLNVDEHQNTNIQNRNLLAEEYPELFNEPTLAVSIDGLGVQNSYDNLSKQNNVVGVCPIRTNKVESKEYSKSLTFTYNNTGSIHTCGVLAQSPFGKSLNVRLFDVSSVQLFFEPSTELQPLRSSRRFQNIVLIGDSQAQQNYFDVAYVENNLGAANFQIQVGDTLRNPATGYESTVTQILGGFRGDGIARADANGIVHDVQRVYVDQGANINAVDANGVNTQLEVFTRPRDNNFKKYSLAMNLKLLYLDNDDMMSV